MVFLLVGWVGIFAFIKIKGFDSGLPSRYEKVFTATALLYPLIETAIKFVIERDLIPYSWIWLNRIEHFGFSAFLVILIFPVIRRFYIKLDLIGQIVFVVGIIVFLGNINEFVEYLVRLMLNLRSKFGHYYEDTIIDLFVNMLGAFAGFGLLKLVLDKKRKNKERNNLR